LSMKKSSLNVGVIFIIMALAIFVIGILTYVSVLGENNKIDRLIVAYFNNLKDGMYLEACESFSSNVQGGQLASDDQRMNFNFLFELSLLKHYNLVDSYDYKVELERSHFWIPFISDDAVRVSVLLKKNEHKGIVDALSESQKEALTRNLIVVGREKGTWKIRQFAIADSAIADTYNDVQKSIDLNKYVKRQPNGFRFNDAEIDFKTLTSIDKRLLRFSLYKIQKSLGQDIFPAVKTKNRIM
jgi:hypothetical protein